MRDPFISIIIPTFNSSKTLKQCLESIYSQTYSNYEIVLVDGLSTDDTCSIVEAYKSNGKNIRIYSEKDSGIYDAMNKGIELSKGDWLFFMGSDDGFYNTDSLSKMCDAISKSTKKIVYGNVKIVGNNAWAKDGEVYAGKFTTKKILNQNICHQAIFYNREYIKNEIGSYNLKYIKSADWDLNLKCWAKEEFEYADVIVCRYSVAGYSGNSVDVELGKDFVANLLKYFGFDLFDPLIDTSEFVYYNDVVTLQKEKHYLRYLSNSAAGLFKRVLNKIR